MEGLSLIKNDEQNRKALNELEILLDKEVAGEHLSEEESDRIELLALLIENYEKKHYPIPDLDPIEQIQLVMEQRGLKQKDLVEILCVSKSTLSKIFSKQRKISLGLAKKLHNAFNLSYDVLLADYELIKT